jgi:hypothetical protein
MNNRAEAVTRFPQGSEEIGQLRGFSEAAHLLRCSICLVNIHWAPHLLRCRALEVQKYVRAPDALHLRHPVNAYN